MHIVMHLVFFGKTGVTPTKHSQFITTLTDLVHAPSLDLSLYPLLQASVGI
jgi:hypothetical protein